MIQTIEASNARRVIRASASPTCRALFWRSGGNRPATIAINTRLSIPSTISRAVSVTKLAQICGSLNHSMPHTPRHLQGNDGRMRPNGFVKFTFCGRRMALSWARIVLAPSRKIRPHSSLVPFNLTARKNAIVETVTGSKTEPGYRLVLLRPPRDCRIRPDSRIGRTS